MTNYSDLTPLQKVQVAFLFADELFGSHADQFTYYLDAHGDVKGRTALVNAVPARCVSSDVQVNMNADVTATDEQMQRVSAATESLARVIAQNIFSEVRHVEHVHA